MSATTHFSLEKEVFDGPRAPRWMRLLARLDGFELDSELARGDDPHAGPLLATRAEQICCFKERKLIARRLYEIACDRPRYGTGNGIRPSRAAVRAAKTDLLDLVELLERPGPANPVGVARARLLLADGSGPLYPPDRLRSLTVAVRRACARLGGAAI